MTWMRRSLTVSILAFVCAGGAVRAEEDKRPAGRATQKGDAPAAKGGQPPAPPTTPDAGKPGAPKQQFNPKEISVDKFK